MDELIICNIWALGGIIAPRINERIACIVLAVVWLVYSIIKNGIV